ncbi:MAG TPA: TetR/AcrR family transcriptional regulator [Acidimicrobiales bacterium]
MNGNADGPTAATVSRRPGRPRDARADEAILDAAVEVLAENGPSGFTIEAVASRAGVGKATIYRRWSSRAALLLDTAHHRMDIDIEHRDTGSLVEDLVAQLAPLGPKLRETPAGRVLPAVMSEAAVNPEMRALLTAFITDRRRSARAIVERAVARGELPADVDVDLVLDQLGGPIFFRVLLADQPVDEPVVRHVVETVVAGLQRRR